MLFYYSRKRAEQTLVDNSNNQSEGLFTFDEGVLLWAFNIFIWGLCTHRGIYDKVPVKTDVCTLACVSLTTKDNDVVLANSYAGSFCISPQDLKRLLKLGVKIYGVALDGRRLISVPVPDKVRARRQVLGVEFFEKNAEGSYLIDAGTTIRLSSISTRIEKYSIYVVGFSKTIFILDGNLEYVDDHFISVEGREFNQHTFEFIIEDTTKVEVLSNLWEWTSYDKAKVKFTRSGTLKGDYLVAMSYIKCLKSGLKSPKIAPEVAERLWTKYRDAINKIALDYLDTCERYWKLDIYSAFDEMDHDERIFHKHIIDMCGASWSYKEWYSDMMNLYKNRALQLQVSGKRRFM